MADHDSKTASTPPRHRIRFEPMGISCLADEGKTISEIALGQGIMLRSDCGGQGQCGQCLVSVHPAENLSPLSDNETALLSSEQIQQGYRLACEAVIHGPLTVTVSASSLDSTEAVGKTLDGKMFANGQAGRKHSDSAGDGRGLGIAVDIGTTTLAVYLCDLAAGKVVASAAAANPQRRFGEDVISRILFAGEKKDGLQRLRRMVVEALNTLLSTCLEKGGALRGDVRDVTVVGNTTMQHIFTGLDPQGLGVSPYAPLTYDAIDITAKEAGLELDSGIPVHVFPVISGFVGGDTVGVIFAEMPHESDQTSLIIDIGTNGEIVLGDRDRLWVTSCATGPALEGAHIECGMRASAGAIHKMTIDPSSYRADYEILYQNRANHPLGLCGSAIIDAVAGMLKTGLIQPSGRLTEGLPGVVADEKGIGRKFIIVPADDEADGREISITLADIRQIQLAKSALSVGIKLLMRKAGISRVDRMVLTGAFGASFNWQNAVAIGMLPEISPATEVATVENAAGRGAVKALLEPESRNAIAEVIRRAHVLELAEDPDFVMAFSAGTVFPDCCEKKFCV